MNLNITQRYSIIAVVCGLLLLALLSGAWIVNLQATTQVVIQQDKPLIIDVQKGTSLYQLLDKLSDEGYIEPTSVLRKIWLKTNPQFALIKSGWYTLSPNMTLVQLLHNIHNGKVTTHQITLVEGHTLWQWLEQMGQLDNIEIDVTFDKNTFTYFDTQGNEWREGYVLPETYRYTHLSKASAILQQAQRAQQKIMKQLLAKNSLPLGIASTHEWVTLASIIEKETGVAHERPHIAGVFLNRIAQKMRLQTDPTVIYGIGPDFNGDITRNNLRTKTPYNTYVIKGLPPTPIAAPTEAALIAVLAPEVTTDLYFVAKGNGEHYFSETLQQHNQAVRQYQLNRSTK